VSSEDTAGPSARIGSCGESGPPRLPADRAQLTGAQDRQSRSPTPWRVIAAWVVALACIAGLAVGFGGPFKDDYSLPGTGSQRATDLPTEHFPAMSGADARVGCGSFALVGYAVAGQGDRELEDRLGVVQPVAEEVADLPHPVPHGLGMDVQCHGHIVAPPQVE